MPCLWLVTCSGTPAFPGSQCSWDMAGVRGWVTLWHHSCLCSGWEERGPSESCQPTAQMPQMPGTRFSQQKQWGISRRHINCERTPSPRQNLPTPTSGGTGTCLSCLPSEDSPQETGRSLAELLQALVRQVFLQESFPGCTPPALDHGTNSPQGSLEAAPYCICPPQAGTKAQALECDEGSPWLL